MGGGRRRRVSTLENWRRREQSVNEFGWALKVGISRARTLRTLRTFRALERTRATSQQNVCCFSTLSSCVALAACAAGSPNALCVREPDYDLR